MGDDLYQPMACHCGARADPPAPCETMDCWGCGGKMFAWCAPKPRTRRDQANG